MARWSEIWLRGRDLNPRPSGYEPDELPDCSTPRRPNCIDSIAAKICTVNPEFCVSLSGRPCPRLARLLRGTTEPGTGREETTMYICIDAGHGGSDLGA